MQLWQGRFESPLDAQVNDFNASIRIDKRMVKEDIGGSIAHATMLGACGIISKEDSDLIVKTLSEMAEEIEKGTLIIDETAEDIHTFCEGELTRRIGDVGKRLHTARSRNDQVAVDFRLYTRARIDEIITGLKELIGVIIKRAEDSAEMIMPGYTHLQRAQPITMGHQLMAYAEMFLRDLSRLEDCKKRLNVSPLGSCALAGTTYPTNRFMTAELLGFSAPCANSIDGVSDRDFAIECASDIAMIMMHLSRFSEEIILWCSFEFKYVELSDSYSTGSSIMPQKKNPDIAELVRGKTGRAYGNLMALLTMMKGIPLAYNKDMQEDKEALFDSLDTEQACITVFAPMLDTLRFIPENMRNAASGGFINATDCADYLVGEKGMPFRTAYKITGEIVAYCIKNRKTLETMTLDEYRSFSEQFDEGIYHAVDLMTCLEKRTSYGGTSVDSVRIQIENAKKRF